MPLSFRLSDDTLSEEEFDILSRRFPADAAQEGLGVEASIDSESSSAAAGSRGELVTLGTFAMAFVTSGSVVALFNILKSYLERSEELSIEFVKKDGSPVKLILKNVSLEKFQGVIKEIDKGDA